MAESFSFSELRVALYEGLTDTLPDTFYISQTPPVDVPSKATVYAQRERMDKAGQPQGFVLNSFKVYLVWPSDQSELAIEDDVETFAQALDSIGFGAWSSADRIPSEDYPAWVFEFSAQSTRL